MARRRKTRRTRRDSHGDRQRSPVAVVDRLLHLQSPDEQPWRFLLPVLVLAFVVRAGIALCVVVALRDVRRYGFLLAMVALVLR